MVFTRQRRAVVSQIDGNGQREASWPCAALVDDGAAWHATPLGPNGTSRSVHRPVPPVVETTKAIDFSGERREKEDEEGEKEKGERDRERKPLLKG